MSSMLYHNKKANFECFDFIKIEEQQEIGNIENISSLNAKDLPC